MVQIARVPGSAAGGRCENGWRRRRLRCATQTDGAACRRERSAARPRRVRAVARFCYRRVDRTRLVRRAARRRQQKVDAALKRRSAFMTCVSGTLGQSTSHGDGRDDAPICKNVSAKFLGGRTLTPTQPPRRLTRLGGRCPHPQTTPALRSPRRARSFKTSVRYYLAEGTRASTALSGGRRAIAP